MAPGCSEKTGQGWMATVLWLANKVCCGNMQGGQKGKFKR